MSNMPAELIAHRGGSGLYLENTLAAFDNAIASGCDGAELDVHLSRDGELVVHHNGMLNHAYTKTPDGQWLTRADEHRLSELTAAQIRDYRIGGPNPDTDYAAAFPLLSVVHDQHIPTLDEVIRRVQQRSDQFTLVIEIKSTCLFDENSRDWQPLVDSVLATVERLGFVERTVLCGFDWRPLRYARTFQPAIPLWMNTHPFDWLLKVRTARSDLAAGKRFLDTLRAAVASGAPWYDGFSPSSANDAGHAVADAGGDLWFGYYTDCTDAAIANAHEAGVGAGAWTVNLRDTDKRTALAARNLNALCVDYF